MVGEATRFRDVLDYAIGGGWGSEVQDEKSDVAVSIIRGTDFAKMQNGQYDEVPLRFESSSKVEKRKLRVGDIVLEVSGGSPMRGQTTGRTYFVSETTLSNLRQPVIPASFCRLVRVDAKKVLPRLAYYWLQDMYSSGRAGLYENQSTGISNFQFERFLDAETIVLPPLEEQRAITETLGALDDRIDNLRQTNATLQAIAAALFKSWFVDFDGVPPEDMQESELGLIPKGWRVASLEEHVDAERGLSYKGAGLAEAGAGVPMHNLNSVLEFGGYKYVGIKHYSGDYKEKHLAVAGDIIVANTEQGHEHRLIGFPAIVPGSYTSGLFSHHLYRVRIKADSPITQEWLYHCLMAPSVREQIIGCANGSTVNMLKPDGLKIPRFTLPPHELCEKFDAIAAPLRLKAEANVEQMETLAALRDALLPRLISGQLRVSQ